MQTLLIFIPVIVLIFVSILWMLERRIRKEVAGIILETINILEKTNDREIHLELIEILGRVYVKLENDSTIDTYKRTVQIES
jgi:hypothetical protein